MPDLAGGRDRGLISPAIDSHAALSSASIAARVSSTGWRKSTVKKTLPGIVFLEFGETSSMPTVEHAFGWFARPMRFTVSTMREAPTSASRRRGIGVGPAWASIPVTVISYQAPGPAPR